MGSYFGRMGKGAARRLREQKRVEAEERDALTPPERRKSVRQAGVNPTHAEAVA